MNEIKSSGSTTTLTRKCSITAAGDDQTKLSHEDNCSSSSFTKRTSSSTKYSTTVGDDEPPLFHRPLFDVTYKQRSWSLIILFLAMLMSMQHVNGSCKAGSFPYHDIFKGEVCQLCPVGSYSFAAQNNCTTCSPGTFSAKIGTSAPCPCCPGGKYANKITGATTCSSCASGLWSPTCSNTIDACSAALSAGPTYEPTGQPTRQPSSKPTQPTGQPTHQPTEQVKKIPSFYLIFIYYFSVSCYIYFRHNGSRIKPLCIFT